MGITTMTGWIAAIFMILNFGTCLVMPWAHRKIRECAEKKMKGKKGCEDGTCHAVLLCQYHKPFVYLTIISVIVHILVSLFA